VTGGKIEGVFLALLPLTAIASFEAVQPLSLAATTEANRRRAPFIELIDASPEVTDPERFHRSQPIPASSFAI
jgi:hypothetical protein